VNRATTIRPGALALALVGILALAASARADDDVVRFDLGVAGAQTDRGWNNVTEAARVGALLSDAKSASGAATTVSYGHVKAFEGATQEGYRGPSPYPCDAMEDGFLLRRRGTKTATIRIGGLSPARRYDLRFFGSQMGYGRDFRTEIEIGNRMATLNVGDNESMRVGFEAVRPDLSGAVTIHVRVAKGAVGASLAVVEIVGDFQTPAGREKEPPLEDVPVVTAEAWAIVDGDTGDFLWGEGEHVRRHGADTSKIMTAWLAVRLGLDERRALDEVATVSKLAAASEGTSVGLREGDKLTVRALLHATLLASGNDAANALAEHFDGRFQLVEASDEPKDASLLTRANFIGEMNRTARELGMQNTTYRLPTGDDANGPVTSARDLLQVSWYAMQDPRFREIVNAPAYTCKVTGADGEERAIELANSNQLLRFEEYNGIKTGSNEKAGHCLVASGNHEQDRLLVCVLGSKSDSGRYVDARNLFRWAWLRRGIIFTSTADVK